MNISYFAEFVELAGSLNFSATASQLNISQPALSNHIQALEEELGVKLFERTRRSVPSPRKGACCWPTPATCWSNSPTCTGSAKRTWPTTASSP